MFDFLIVYPAALGLGFLVGIVFPRRGSRGKLIALFVSGLQGMLLAIIGSLAYLDLVGASRWLTEMALPAASFCFAFGLVGGLIGIGVRALVGGMVRTWRDPT